MMVKICGITNRDDALAAAAAGATALGFNFYPKSPRYVGAETVASILEVLPSNILKVGVFVNEPADCIAALAETLPLDVVQLHGELAEYPEGVRVWRAIRVVPGFHISELNSMPAEAFLLDTPSRTEYGGTGQTFDWSLARGATRPVILAGGLDETNVRRAIDAAQPCGVDACSRIESAPGRKDHARMSLFIKAALS